MNVRIYIKRLLKRIRGEFKLLYIRLKFSNQYVTWDGVYLKAYRPPKGHDCAIFEDGMISVQNARRDFIESGFEPIVIFSCKSGTPSYQVNFPGQGWDGLFTHSLWKVLKRDLKLKDLIRQTNIEMRKSGLIQECEVICKLKYLFRKYRKLNKRGENVICLQYDMCRTESNSDLRIINK